MKPAKIIATALAIFAIIVVAFGVVIKRALDKRVADAIAASDERSRQADAAVQRAIQRDQAENKRRAHAENIRRAQIAKKRSSPLRR